MLVRKALGSMFLCAVMLMTVGCKENKEKDDFIDTEFPQPVIVENVVMETEFAEYDGNTERIRVKLRNDRDEDFTHGAYFFVQKLDGDEWRYLGVSGNFSTVTCSIPSGWDGWEFFQLKDHVKQPLLPGKYRIGYSSFGHEELPTPVAEFTVK